MNFMNDITEGVIAWFHSKALPLFGLCAKDIQLGQGKALTLLSSTFTSDSEMLVTGSLMRQQLEISEFQSHDGKVRVIHVHRRSINDRFIDSYRVVNSSNEESVQISTPMSKDAIAEFETEWTKKWNGGHLAIKTQ